MSALESREEELEDVRAVQFVTGTLLEISAERIVHLREKFEQNRLFYSEISDLYSLVKRSAARRNELVTTMSAKKAAISIAFTSNSRFYGVLNRRLIEAFVKHMGEHERRSFMVIGSVGKRLLEGTPHKGRPVFVAFSSDEPTHAEVSKLLGDLESYGEVLVYHPQFVNVFLQDVGVLNMTHTGTMAEDDGPVEYLFEPELPRILSFFETRVRYLLFQRAMLESELARTAARLTTMSQAEERAREKLVRVRADILREHQTLDSLKLLELFSGTLRWRKAAQNDS